jgi:endogenous inhibitor of DNA gyrase (YacG/DUF329 family)
MTAFLDDRCPKCGKRFGWRGRAADRPACPKCGHQVPAADLAAADAELDAFRRLLATHPRNATATELRGQRVAAGLTVGQAVGQTGIPLGRLLELEGGHKPTEAEAAALAAAYGCGSG